MNLRQRIALFVGLLIEAVMLLYPPWKCSGWPDDPYRSILSPTPLGNGDWYSRWSLCTLDEQRLGFQCLIVAVAVIGLVVILGAKKSKDSN
jgi:hypothetical protein